MNGVIGTISHQAETVLTGSHYIIQTVKIKDGLKDLKAGTILVYESGTYRPATAADKTYDAVLVEPFADKTADTALTACLHGTVKAEKLILGDDLAKETVRPALRAAGIYATGALAAE